jgi:predicted SAM-dependent methyltransferase
VGAKLNLGCSSAHHPGYLNVDIAPPADQIADLNKQWPWADSSIDAILGIDIIEHLPNKIFTMNELHRVLKPGAMAELEVPITPSDCAFADPTHASFWNRKSFCYYEAGHPYHLQYAVAYGITACFKVAEEYVRTMRDGPKLLIKLEKVDTHV